MRLKYDEVLKYDTYQCDWPGCDTTVTYSDVAPFCGLHWEKLLGREPWFEFLTWVFQKAREVEPDFLMPESFVQQEGRK
jgi:hypothetical protein